MRNYVFNEAMKLRRKTIVKMAQLFMSDKLKEELPKLNRKLLPGPDPTYRASLYHEREVLKQRIKLYLGMNYEESKDLELYEVADKLEEILADKEKNSEFVQVIKEACDACPSGKYYATDLCRNCVAHSCQAVCPKNAITIESGRAKINPELCVGCGLCEKSCNYFAIVKLQRPCERACFPKALKSDLYGAAEIEKERCVSCASCYVACPFGAIESKSHLLKVLAALKNKEEISVMYAPSIIAQFGPKVEPGNIKAALIKAGFTNAYDVAKWADDVAQEEAELVENSENMVTTSCCPAFVEYIEKHQSDFKENISPALSPMAECAKHVKKPNEKLVFIGPCIAKKMEAYKNGSVDYVITFEEAAALFIATGVEPSMIEKAEIDGSSDGWNFAASGGVAQAVVNKCKKELKVLTMNGLVSGKESFSFAATEKFDIMEGMACEGGCICGPGIMVNPKVAKAMLGKLKNK